MTPRPPSSWARRPSPLVIEKLASNNAGITRAAPVIVWDQVWD